MLNKKPKLRKTPLPKAVGTAFKTHLNYIKCLDLLTKDLEIGISRVATKPLDAGIYKKFTKLANITRKSIEGERLNCKKEPAYAQVAAPWIPVKCYYHLYYLESIFLYLLKGSMVGFSVGGHKKVRSEMAGTLASGDINFKGKYSEELADICSWGTAQQFSTESGANLKDNYYKTKNCIGSILKLLTRYVELDFKNSENIGSYRTKINKVKKEKLLKKTINILDYFYWMRIKANYRDVDFLDFDNEITEDEANDYLIHFVEATEQYANVLEKTIAQLKKQRSMT